MEVESTAGQGPALAFGITSGGKAFPAAVPAFVGLMIVGFTTGIGYSEAT